MVMQMQVRGEQQKYALVQEEVPSALVAGSASARATSGYFTPRARRVEEEEEAS